MGIRLDWQIESEQTKTRATEDPAARERRLRARTQFLLLIAGLACVLGLIVVAIVWRLRSVDTQYRQDLLDTVEIEVTALRLGDFANFMAIQRSASSGFLLEQSRIFEDYQALKQQGRITLTGSIADATIDELRGRVIVEEVIDGVPYHVVWFYWYYEDGGESDQGGWRRVPDDLTFWGDERTLTREHVTLHYQTMDEALAGALIDRLDEWWGRGCALLGCIPPQNLTVSIVAERPASVAWSPLDPWTLRITSPLTGRARADVALTPDLEREIAQQVAHGLVSIALGETTTASTIFPGDHSALQPTTDADWLIADTARWLAETLLAGTGSTAAAPGLIGSLVTQYGPGAPSIVLAVAQDRSIPLDGALVALSGLPMSLISPDQLNSLDWSGFFRWRLALEGQTLAQPETRDHFLNLYDMTDPNASNSAYVRLGDPAYAARPIPAVQRVTVTRETEANQTYAYADISLSSGDSVLLETVLWRVIDGTWKRAS